MTPTDKKLVRETFAMVLPIADQAAALFYGRLFEVAPEYRPMFKGDIGEQGKKLMQMIGVGVAHLDRLEEVLLPLQELGRRHSDYGVTAADYDRVAEVLLWTLGQGLGEAFTPEVEQAWTNVYCVLAQTMLEGTIESGVMQSVE